MGSTAIGIGIGIVLLFGLPIVILLIRDRIQLAISRGPAAQARMAEERQAYENRLLLPDWALYERHLRRPVPTAIRELYADKSLIISGGLEYQTGEFPDDEEDILITSFAPLDEQELTENRRTFGFEVMPIAYADDGGPIYLLAGESEGNAVYFCFHELCDGSDHSEIADDVTIFVERLRQSHRSV